MSFILRAESKMDSICLHNIYHYLGNAVTYRIVFVSFVVMGVTLAVRSMASVAITIRYDYTIQQNITESCIFSKEADNYSIMTSALVYAAQSFQPDIWHSQVVSFTKVTESVCSFSMALHPCGQ